MWRHLIEFDAAAPNIPLRAGGGTNRPLIFTHDAQDFWIRVNQRLGAKCEMTQGCSSGVQKVQMTHFERAELSF